MAPKRDLFALGLDITDALKDIDKLVNYIKQSLDKVGSNSEIEGVVQQLEEMRQSMASLAQTKLTSSKFAAFEKDMRQQVETLGNRTERLQTLMGGLIETLNSADQTSFKAWLNDVVTGMDRVATSAGTLTDVIGNVIKSGGGSVNIIDTNGIDQTKKTLDDLRKSLLSILEEDYGGGFKKVKFDSFEAGVRVIKAGLDEAEKAAADFQNTLAGGGNIEPALRNFIKIGHKTMMVYDDMLEKYEQDIPKELEQRLNQTFRDISGGGGVAKQIYSSLKEYIASLSSVTQQAIEIKSGATQQGIRVPIELTETGGSFAEKALKVVQAAQKKLAGEALEVELVFISPGQGKKANAALKEFQEQVNKIQDADTRQEMQALVDQVSNGFAQSITVQLRNAVQNTTADVRNLIKDINAELKKEPIIITPEVKFTEDDLAKLKDNMSRITSDFKATVEELLKSGAFSGDVEKAGVIENLEKDITRLNTAVKALETDLPNITDGFNESIIDILINSSELIKELGWFSTFDMGQGAAKGLADELGRALDELKQINSLSGKQSDKNTGATRDANIDRLLAEYPTAFIPEILNEVGKAKKKSPLNKFVGDVSNALWKWFSDGNQDLIESGVDASDLFNANEIKTAIIKQLKANKPGQSIADAIRSGIVAGSIFSDEFYNSEDIGKYYDFSDDSILKAIGLDGFIDNSMDEMRKALFNQATPEKLKTMFGDALDSVFNAPIAQTKDTSVIDGVIDHYKEVLEVIRQISTLQVDSPENYTTAFAPISENISNLATALANSKTDAGILSENLQKLSGFDMGAKSATTLAEQLERSVAALDKLSGFMNGENPLVEVGELWGANDNLLKIYFKDEENTQTKQNPRMLERNGVLGTDYKLYYIAGYDKPTQTGVNNLAIQALPPGVSRLADLHSHSSDRIATPSLANLHDLNGDLFAWRGQMSQTPSMKYALTYAIDTVQLVDTDQFYKEASKRKVTLKNGKEVALDFSERGGDLAKIVSRTQLSLDAASQYYKLAMVPEMADKFSGEGTFSKFARDLLDNLEGYYHEELEDDLSNEQRNNFEKILRQSFLKPRRNTNISEVLQDAISEVVGNQYDISLRDVMSYTTNDDIKRQLGLERFNLRDLQMFQHTEWLDKAMSGYFLKLLKYGYAQYDDEYAVPLNIEDLTKKYFHNYTKSEFSVANPLGLGKNVLQNLFSDSGIESFSAKVETIASSLEKLTNLSDAISSIGQNGIAQNLQIDESLITNVSALVDGLIELLNVVDELSTIRYNPTQDFVERLSFIGNDADGQNLFSQRLAANLNIRDNPNKDNIINDIIQLGAGLDKSSTTYYQEWASAIAKYCDEAGIAIDEFAEKERVLNTAGSQLSGDFNISIDQEQLKKANGLLTTIKNSINSLRKEFKDSDFNFKIDLTPITTQFTELIDVMRRAHNLFTGDMLAKDFADLQSAAKGVRPGTKRADSIVEQYLAYRKHGGTEDIKNIGGGDKFQKYIQNAYQNATKSAENVQEESSALAKVREDAEKAAEAKEKFTLANEQLLQQITASINGLQNEGKAFTELRKLILELGKADANDASKNKLAEALQKIYDIISKPIPADSFLKELQALTIDPAVLKDLSTVLSSSANQRKGAKQAQREQQRKTSESILNGNIKDVYDFAELAMQGIPGYGSPAYIDLHINSDGLIEAIGYIKDVNDEWAALKVTSQDGIDFNQVEIKTPSNQALKFAKLREKLLNNNKPSQNWDAPVIFDPSSDQDLWDDLIDAWKTRYAQALGELQKVTYQTRQAADGTLLESFSFFGENGHVTMDHTGQEVASHNDIGDLQELTRRVDELSKKTDRYYKLRAKVADGSISPYEKQEFDELDNAYKKIIHDVQEYYKIVQMLPGLNADANLETSFNKFVQSEIDDKTKQLSNIRLNAANNDQKFSSEYADDLTRAESILENISKIHNIGTPWNDKEISKILSDFQKIDNIINAAPSKSNKLVETAKVDNIIAQASKDLADNSIRGDLAARYQDLIDELSRVRVAADDTTNTVSALDEVSFKRLESQYKALHAEMMRTGQYGKDFWNTFSQSISSKSAQFLAQYFSLQDIIRYVRSAVSTVTSVDSALIELRKVSDASNERIQQSFRKSAQTAQELGATITDVINSTSDWARLNILGLSHGDVWLLKLSQIGETPEVDNPEGNAKLNQK